MKICARCKIPKNLNEFYVSPKGKVFYICLTCSKERRKEWRKNNPEKYRAQRRRKRLKISYKITTTIYEKMLTDQNGKCAICGKTKNQTQSGKEIPFGIDHCHKTGQIRGLLCNKCNSAIGFFEDRIPYMELGIAYLRKYEQKNPPVITQEGSVDKPFKRLRDCLPHHSLLEKLYPSSPQPPMPMPLPVQGVVGTGARHGACTHESIQKEELVAELLAP